MKNNYKGFTLVEMLVVMGILMILMAVGIASGRYAIQRANDIAHQDAADELWDALVGYYTDKRIYPKGDKDCDRTSASVGASTDTFTQTPEKLTTDCLINYLDGSFDGGSATTYYYAVATNRQSAIVCVAKGGVGDESERGFYCTGNGFNDTALFGELFNASEYDHTGEPAQKLLTSQDVSRSDWNGKEWTKTN